MAEPKKRRSSRRQGMHRSHLVRQLAKRVNAHSPVKVKVGGKKKTTESAASPAKKADAQ